MLPELLPLAIAVILLSAIGVYFITRGFKPPPRGDSLPSTVPIALSKPDLERFADAAADCVKAEDPQAGVTGQEIVAAIREGHGEVRVSGMFDEHVAFRWAGYDVTVDRAGKLVSLARA